MWRIRHCFKTIPWPNNRKDNLGWHCRPHVTVATRSVQYSERWQITISTARCRKSDGSWTQTPKKLRRFGKEEELFGIPLPRSVLLLRNLEKLPNSASVTSSSKRRGKSLLDMHRERMVTNLIFISIGGQKRGQMGSRSRHVLKSGSLGSNKVSWERFYNPPPKRSFSSSIVMLTIILYWYSRRRKFHYLTFSHFFHQGWFSGTELFQESFILSDEYGCIFK